MDYQQMIEAMSREVYDSLRRALELGKWPDGRRLSAEQRQETMQAVIAWGEMHLPPEQRVGYIDRGSKAGETCADPGVAPLNFRD
ncbi:MAG: DUF1315 family protein [Halioglobus sp.]|nr:DUF1315 family protein [Halioglobus sp.]